MVLKEYPGAGDASAALVDVQRGDFAFILGKAAKDDRLEIDTPFAKGASRATAGGIGTLSLASLLFAAMEEAEALAPKHEYFDDGQIAEDYSEEPHGRFVLDTKEAVPRRILVEDPGVTYALRLTTHRKSVSVRFLTVPPRWPNSGSFSRMFLQTYSVGLSAFQGPTNTGPNGSTTNPNLELPQGARPISFSPSDNGGVSDHVQTADRRSGKNRVGWCSEDDHDIVYSCRRPRSLSVLPPPPDLSVIPPPPPPSHLTSIADPLIGPLSGAGIRGPWPLQPVRAR